MAAAGGSLQASVVLAGVNSSTTVRCRFPARPCTSRSQARAEKRSKIGRRGTENEKAASKGPRPVNIGLTLQEDPSLLRLLRIAEKHERKREAGFDSSGSEEEGGFVGFEAGSGRTLRSSRNLSQNDPLQSMSSPPEKPPPAPDLKEKDVTRSASPAVTPIKPLYGKVVKRSDKSRNDGRGSGARNSSKPKLVVKFAVKRTTKEISPPKTEAGQQTSKDSKQAAKALPKDPKISKSEGRPEKLDSEAVHAKKLHNQHSTTSKVSVTPKGQKNLDAHGASAVKPPSDQTEGTSRKRQNKVVWSLTLVKGQGKESLAKGPEASKVTGPMLGKFVKRHRPPGGGGGGGAGPANAHQQQPDSGAPPQQGAGSSEASSSSSTGGQRRNPSHLLWIPQKRRTRDVAGGSTAAVSPTAAGKQRRISKAVEGSPEEGAEAELESGTESSDQAATVTSSGEALRGRIAHFKYKRRGLIGSRRKHGLHATEPSSDEPTKHKRHRGSGLSDSHVPLHSEIPQTTEKPQQEPPQDAAGAAETTAEVSQSAVTSGRSSRVIKTPKRFLDDERMSHLLPKTPPVKKPSIVISEGSSQDQLDPDGKPLHHRPVGNRKKSQGDDDVMSQEDDSTSADIQPSPRPIGVFSPGPANLKFYQRLKKLTATLAEKRMQRGLGRGRGLADEREEDGDVGSSRDHGNKTRGPLRKKRRSKLTVEDIKSSGVVRKLAVHLNAAGATLASTQGVELTAGVAAEGPCLKEQEGSAPGDFGEHVLLEQGGTTQRISVSSSNKRMFHLLKRAKVQLIKIDQQKQLKSAQLLSGTVKLGESTELGLKRRRRRRLIRDPTAGPGLRQQQLLSGPRIKHVCRAAAVALGQPRAMVPDDVPRLSALPMHERQGIAPSPTVEDAAEGSGPESESETEVRPVRKRGGWLRSRRCLRCRGCLREDDCGTCIHCLDKPKFGGPNRKKQCCIHRICSRIALKKAQRMGIRHPKVQVRRGGRSSASGNGSSGGEEEEVVAEEATTVTAEEEDAEEEEDVDGEWKETATTPPRRRKTPSDLRSPSPTRRQPRRNVTHPCFSDLLRSESDSDHEPEPTPTRTPAPPTTSDQQPTVPTPSPRKMGLTNESTTPPAVEEGTEVIRPRRLPFGRPGRRRFDKSSTLHTNNSAVGMVANNTALAPTSTLAAIANRFVRRETTSRPSNTHRILIDFKEDCSVQNVWLMGGLSVLTSIPISPDAVCLLCASKGKHELLYCQVCCEPFHTFCLKQDERPQEENKENWCCRRCKYCHVCGRKSKHARPVLQCRRCLYCYHPSCLGPTYPKPLKCSLPWVCMKCICCKSCGITPGKSWEMAWNHEDDLCPDCSVLHKLGNYCPVCHGCYEDVGTRQGMLKCARCTHWVHSKCEKISEEECDRMKRRAVGGFICTPCGMGSWRAELHEELNIGLRTVMATLLDSPLTQDILICQQCETSVEDTCVQSGSNVCDLLAVSQKLEKGVYSTLRAFGEDIAMVMKRKFKDEGQTLSPNDELRSLFMQLMKESFSWLNGGHLKTWEPLSPEFPSGMLPEAVFPPSEEHSYAQWLEKDHLVACGEKEILSPGKRKSSYQDDRQCSLCQQHGDALPSEAGRLLYLGQNEWAHVNCCIWSAEVQDNEGALLHVHAAVNRGRFMRCDRCGLSGATVGCCLTSCQGNFHFMCARVRNCVFQEDRKVYCHLHKDLIDGKLVSGSGFEVLRRAYVDFEGFNLRRRFLTGLEPDTINMMIGSMQIHHLGILTELSANSGKLFPLGYRCSRWYWSTVNPRRRCRYTCQVRETRPSQMPHSPERPVYQGSNQTIAHSPAPHQDMESNVDTKPEPVEKPLDALSPKPKIDAGSKPGHPHARRAVGGFRKPLPSPGNPMSKSHHILTISDLDETRRPRRLGSVLRCRNSSPPRAESARAPSAKSVFQSTNRSTSPGKSPFQVLSQTRNVPALHRQHPLVQPRQSCVNQTLSDEVSQDFLVSSDSENVALCPVDCPPMEKSNNVDKEEDENFFDSEGLPSTQRSEEVALVMEPNQGELYGHFDADAEAAVASLLSSRFEFDESILQGSEEQHCDITHNNVEDHCEVTQTDEGQPFDVPHDDEGVQCDIKRAILDCEDGNNGGDKGGMIVLTEKSSVKVPQSTNLRDSSHLSSLTDRQENDSSDEDDQTNYMDFSRTVVLQEASKEAKAADLVYIPTSGTISQLDGADNESESDAGETMAEDDSQELTSRGSQSHDSEPSSGTTSSTDHVSSATSAMRSSESRKAVDTSETITILSDSSDSSTDSVLEEPRSETLPGSSQLPLQSRPFSNPRVRIIETPSPGIRIRMLGPSKTLSSAALRPRGRGGRPRGRGRSVLSKATPPAVRAVPLTDPLTAAPIVINGFDSTSQNAAPKGKPIAIRLTNPKQQTEQPSGVTAGGVGTLSTPQILLVNRFGQILVKDPQSNTFQSPRSTSPSFNNISQIAKIIHSRNVLPRPVPKILLTPMRSQQRATPPSSGITTHIISYNTSTPNNGQVQNMASNQQLTPEQQSAVPTLVSPQVATQVQTLVQVQARPLMPTSTHARTVASTPSLNPMMRVKNVTLSLKSQARKEGIAQDIIEKAMASHRNVVQISKLSPSQFTVPSCLSKLESPETISPTPSVFRRTRPAILSKSSSQVRMKRVSSLAERIAVKRCRTDFLPQAPLVAKEDQSSNSAAARSNGVRVKAPSSKDVLDLDLPPSDRQEQLKQEAQKQIERKIEMSQNVQTAAPKGALGGGVPAKRHVWVSARDGDLSDWGPFSGLSSDEESSPPKRTPAESLRKDQPCLSFVITSDDGFKVEADSIEVAWRAVLEGVQEARIGCGMRQLPGSVLSGAQLLGVVHNAVLYLLEQLQGADRCRSHRFRYHFHHQTQASQEELPINLSGCARAEVYERKSTFDMFDFLASQHRKPPEYTAYDEEEDDIPLKSARRATNSELPAAMRFRHLKRTAKEAVGVYRSLIHGRGLFCKRIIEAGEMVIEYAGNVIRAVLTDKREKHYDRKGIGCYMFRIDDFEVVDATMHGNAGRFINHSCDPNCYSRVISVDGQKHIVIFALRRIHPGEELTYDYKFPIEDANSKLHCNCGARRCRRFLN